MPVCRAARLPARRLRGDCVEQAPVLRQPLERHGVEDDRGNLLVAGEPREAGHEVP